MDSTLIHPLTQQVWMLKIKRNGLHRRFSLASISLFATVGDKIADQVDQQTNIPYTSYSCTLISYTAFHPLTQVSFIMHEKPNAERLKILKIRFLASLITITEWL